MRRSGSKSSPTALSCLLAAFLASAGTGVGPLIAAEVDAVRLATAKSAAFAHAAQTREQLGLSAAEVAELGISSIVPTRHNGLTHVYLVQRVNGLEVVSGILNVAVDRTGKAVYATSSVVAQASGKAAGQTAVVAPEQAIAAAADHLGVRLSAKPNSLEYMGGITQASRFAGDKLSQDEIPLQLKYLPVDEGAAVRLVWEMVLRPAGGLHWWQLFVDAETGDVLRKFDWMSQDTYNVFPIPAENPSQVPQSTVINPADANASPFGWHDTNGAAGAEFTDTRGNNVFAQDDIDANDTGGVRPTSASLSFTSPFNPAQDPAIGTNLNAAIVNLFYMNNIMHDFTYQYGFDEPAGNFQENNYGNGGLEGDAVIADAQDGSGTNNANFATPPDGQYPRMQMFVWMAPPGLTVNTPPAAAGTYAVAAAGFGPQITQAGFTNDIVLVNDGVGTVTDGCETPFVNAGAMTGKIAIVDRGGCEFGIKVLNLQNNGALAGVVVNNAPGDPTEMGPGSAGGSVTIPSVMIGQTNGNLIKANLPANAKLSRSLFHRDSDNDNGVIAHEYGHGISTRLTGGPKMVDCLENDEQMGEGWSDFFALVTTAKASDTATTLRPMASYLAFNSAGIRPFPYTTDNTVNTHTYGNVGSVAIPHGVGSIWSVMLWEMYWRLVAEYGYDTDLYNGTGGNNLAIQLVIDGMKLQVCSPGFVDGRDAILAADRANNCGVNKCPIWEAFAERGLGLSANQGLSTSVADGTPAFDLPSVCTANLVFSGDFDNGSTCAWSLTIP